MYANMNSERLRFISTHKTELIVADYIHLQDSRVNPYDVGQKVILPSSFVNSPRYLYVIMEGQTYL